MTASSAPGLDDPPLPLRVDAHLLRGERSACRPARPGRRARARRRARGRRRSHRPPPPACRPARSTTSGTSTMRAHPAAVAAGLAALGDDHVGAGRQRAPRPGRGRSPAGSRGCRASWARAMSSANTPMWNEIAAGREAQRRRERLLVERADRVVDRERLVGPLAQRAATAPRARQTAAPRSRAPPSPPASQTAAASSTSSHGPNGAHRTGTSIPSRSHSGVRSTTRSS